MSRSQTRPPRVRITAAMLVAVRSNTCFPCERHKRWTRRHCRVGQHQSATVTDARTSTCRRGSLTDAAGLAEAGQGRGGERRRRLEARDCDEESSQRRASHGKYVPPLLQRCFGHSLSPLGFNFSQHGPTTRPSVERTAVWCSFLGPLGSLNSHHTCSARTKK